MPEENKQNQELEGNFSDEDESNFDDEFESMFGRGVDDDDNEEEDESSDDPNEDEGSDDEGDQEVDKKDDEEDDNDEGRDDKPNPNDVDPRKLANLPVEQLYGVVDEIKDPVVKSRVQEIISRAERFRGSQSALTKKVQGYEQSVRQLEAQIQKVNEREPDKESRGEAKAPQSLEALKAKYPQLAQAIEDTVAFQKERGGEGLSREEVERMVTERLAPVERKYSEDTLNAEMQRLDEMAADLFDTKNTGIKASDIIVGEYSEDFKAWLSSQPESVQNMARAATDADAAYVLLERYEMAYQKRRKELEGEEEQEQKPDATKTKNEQSTKADEIRKKRESRLKKGDTPASSSRGAPGESPDSFDALFNSWFGKGGKYVKR